jgi:predicted nucleic-acid-binding protein
MLFLDTDIFVVYLTQSGTPKVHKARKVFAALESGSQKVTTSSLVLCEVVNVLHSSQGYFIPKEPLADALVLLLSLRNFWMKDKQVLMDALELWREKPIEFIDAYNQTFMHAHGATRYPD